MNGCLHGSGRDFLVVGLHPKTLEHLTHLVAALSLAEKGLTFSGSAPAAAWASVNSCQARTGAP